MKFLREVLRDPRIDAAKRANWLESMRRDMEGWQPVLAGGGCAVCLGNGYILMQNETRRACLCVKEDGA